MQIKDFLSCSGVSRETKCCGADGGTGAQIEKGEFRSLPPPPGTHRDPHTLVSAHLKNSCIQGSALDASGDCGELESHAVSLCCCLEALTEASKSVHESCLQWASLMPHYLLLEHTSAVDVSSELLRTLCHQTTLYCTKLLQVSCLDGVWTCGMITVCR